MQKEKMIWQTKSVSLNVTANRIDSYRLNEETKNTVRVYEDRKIGVAGSLGDFNEAELTEAAKRALSYEIEYPCHLSKNVKTVENTKEIIPEKEFISKMQSLLDKLSAECPNFAFSNKINLSNLKAVYENSLGSSLLSTGSWLDFSLVIQNKGSGNLFECDYEACLKNYDENAILKDCKEMYNAFYTDVDIEDGEYPVFILPENLFSPILKHFYANTYASGASLLSGKLGEKIFNESFTFCDDRNPETDPSACFFDDEGEIAPDFRQTLIKDGVLTNVLTCKMYSEKLNLPFAATSYADYDSVPSVGFNNFYVKPTADTAKEITSERSVLVHICSGGDMTPDGHFATPVQLAFLVENGVIKGRLPEIDISGDLFDLLGKDYLGTAENAFFPSKNKQYMACRMKVNK